MICLQVLDLILGYLLFCTARCYDLSLFHRIICLKVLDLFGFSSVFTVWCLDRLLVTGNYLLPLSFAVRELFCFLTKERLSEVFVTYYTTAHNKQKCTYHLCWRHLYETRRYEKVHNSMQFTETFYSYRLAWIKCSYPPPPRHIF